MSARDVALAVAATSAWGFSFVLIKLGLDDLPPLLFAAMRFLGVAIPWVLFVPFPDVGWRWTLFVGLVLGVGQFGMLFVAIDLGMPAGVAAVVLQAQVPLTVLAATVVLSEPMSLLAAAGVATSTFGLALIGLDRGGAGLLPFILVIGAAAAWAASNIAIRVARPAQPVALIVWSSMVAPVPLVGLSLIFDGPDAIGDALSSFSLGQLGVVLYVSLVATLGAFSAWALLLRRYSPQMVAPFGLLIPLVGLVSTWAVLGEEPSVLELAGAFLVLCGLVGATLGMARQPRAPSLVLADTHSRE